VSGPDEELPIWVAYDRPELADRLQATARHAGFVLERCIDLRTDRLALDGCRILVMEERSAGATLFAKVQAVASSEPDLMLVVLVDAGARDSDPALFAAGAFDVVDDGPGLEGQMFRAIAMAKRFLGNRDERKQLHEELAHQERLSAIGMLAAGVGHEVNNPNSAILVNLELIRSQLESVLAHPRFQQIDVLQEHSSDWLEALGDSIGASRRITSIVQSLNVFSRRAEEGAPEPVNINSEVSSVLRLIGKEVQFQAHTTLELAPNMPHIMAPPHVLTQVVTNLVLNALQALEAKPREERHLAIRTTFDEMTVMLEVSDDGPGIPPEHVGRIFDPFFTTKRTGNGLGLAITREIVQKANGEIFVDSGPGGATFRTVFERADDLVAARRPVSWVPPGSWRMRVLIVDDDVMLLRSIARTLADQFECIPVTSGDKAVAFLKQDAKIDVVLSDIVMPGTNGLELYETIRADFPHLAHKTIFFSGGVRSEELRSQIAKTGRPCVAKPFEIRELVRLMRAIDRGVE